ncbi:SDR family oxidoreductase [Nocardia sp. NPDC051052]|uniref:SDR family oxidoreductase n=1 Tax=Nocardia sp. NPDC051052 TaxID=3364322 RepID=UPI0037A35C25
MRVVVHGATGAQGGPVAEKLTEQGVDVVRVSRHAGPSNLRADLDEPDSMEAAYRGADGVFFHFPLGTAPERERRWVETVAAAARTAGVGQVVVSTSGRRQGTPAAKSVDLLVDRLRILGITTTVLAPLYYLENLLLPPVLAGVRDDSELRYPISDTVAMSWTSHLDVADAAAAVFTQGAEAPALVAVGQLPPLRGADLAAGFSVRAGRPIRFVPIAPIDFGHEMAPIIGAQAAKSVAAGYESIAAATEIAFPEGNSAAALLGLKPRNVDDWLEELDVPL